MKMVKKGFTLLELVCVMAIMGFLFLAILSMTTPSQKIHRKTAVSENTYAMADNVQQYVQRTLDYADAAWVFTDADFGAEGGAYPSNITDFVAAFKDCYYKNVVIGENGTGGIQGKFAKGKIHILKLMNKGDDAGQIRHIEVDFTSNESISGVIDENTDGELVLNPAYFAGDNERFHITYAMNPSELQALGEVNRNADAFMALKSEMDGEAVRKSVVGQSLSIVVNQGTNSSVDESGVTYTRFEGPAVITIANIPFSNIAAKMSMSSEGDKMYASGCSRRPVQADGSNDTYLQGTTGMPAEIDYDIPDFFKDENKTGSIPNAFCNLTTQKVSTQNDIYYVYAYASDLTID